jgi:magnesium transporter
MAPRFRVMDVSTGGAASVVEGPDQVRPPPSGTMRWIDLAEQDAAELRLLGERFAFHPLALEDCDHFDQRPKLEEYGDYLFVVVHAFACPRGDPGEVDPLEMHAFLGPNYLVTVHAAQIPALDAVWKRIEGDPNLGQKGADFVLYLVADAVVDANFPIIDLLSDHLDQIEDSVLEGPKSEDLTKMFELKRTLVLMRKVLSPERDLFAVLTKRGDPRVSEKTALYFRDVYDRLVRIQESIDTSRDLLSNALDAYLSMASNRTNEIMKRLTLLSAVFLPLTFITGFFGQNFEHLPFQSDALMYVMLATCALIPTGMVLWFRRSGWF